MPRVLIAMVLLTGCGSSFTPEDGGGADAGSMDAGVVDGGGGSDAGDTDAGFVCTPITCEIDCMYGFQRDADGCEICACNPAPIDTCAADADCVLARVATGCCGCEGGYPVAQVEADPCLVTRRETPPPGCLPDPDFCAMVDCAACEGLVRAYCDGGTCQGSSECAPGEVQIGLDCVPACTAHADCAMGADYGNCCGSCQAVPRAYFDVDECWAERSADSACAPAPGACDGLGCASPSDDCTAFSGTPLCMDDGTCREGGSDGACPPGYHDESSVCVAD